MDMAHTQKILLFSSSIVVVEHRLKSPNKISKISFYSNISQGVRIQKCHTYSQGKGLGLKALKHILFICLFLFRICFHEKNLYHLLLFNCQKCFLIYTCWFESVQIVSWILFLWSLFIEQKKSYDPSKICWRKKDKTYVISKSYYYGFFWFKKTFHNNWAIFQLVTELKT